MYRIKISYSTGNSLGSEDTWDYLELTWKNLDIAKENLQRIKEHYTLYEGVDGYRTNKPKHTLIKECVDKPWFVNEPKLFCISTNNAIDEKYKAKVGADNWEYRPEEYAACYNLKLKADNGNEMRMRAFWCGYFEQLHEAEIEIDDSDMRIKFN